jgi:hypothetical protein
MIFVTGCARSGTTLITRMLEACGANLGEAGSLAEHMPFKEKVLKPYLRRCNADPLGQNPLPDEMNLPVYDTLRSDIDAVTPYADVIKDVKTALIWPKMVEAFPDAKWVIVYRDPKKIAQSCVRTSFMSAYGDEPEWENWAKEYHRRCTDLSYAADTHTVVTSDVIEDVEQLRITVEWLGFDFDPDVARKVIRKSKWHGG